VPAAPPPRPRRSPRTPPAGCALAEAEHGRAARRRPTAALVRRPRHLGAARAPPLAAYCRWRQAEALVAAGASRAEASRPLQAGPRRRGPDRAKPSWRSSSCSPSARGSSSPPPDAEPPDRQGLGEVLGLTPREAEVLATSPAATPTARSREQRVISVRTAGVHVSHILRKLDAPNRLEAAAIAHRLADA
jgi:DNA-binding CsgD family transcriptional regulator